GNDAVQGIALADAGQIDLEPRPQKTHGARVRIEAQVAHAYLGAGALQFRRRRHAAGPAIKAPRLDEGADRDVEGAAGFFSQLLRLSQELEKSGLDRYG